MADEPHVPHPPRHLDSRALAAVRAWPSPSGAWLYRVWVVARPGWTYPMNFQDAAACLAKAGYTAKGAVNCLNKARKRYRSWKASTS